MLGRDMFTEDEWLSDEARIQRKIEDSMVNAIVKANKLMRKTILEIQSTLKWLDDLDDTDAVTDDEIIFQHIDKLIKTMIGKIQQPG